MTTPTPPSGTPRPTPEEAEVVNAYVDGEATPEEVARVEGDTELRAAADRVRSLRAALGDHVPAAPDEDVRETHIAAALSEFESAPAAVSDLSAHRERKAWYQRMPMGAVATAAVIVLVAVVAGLAQLGSDDRDDTATVADEDTTSEDLAAESGAGMGQADDGAALEGGDSAAGREVPTTTITSMAAPQQSYDTVDDFLDAVDDMPRTTANALSESGAEEQTASGGTSDGSDDPDPLSNCPDVRDRYIRDFDDLHLVTGTVDGRDMVAILYVDDGEQHSAVYDVSDAGCEFVAER